MPANTSFYVEMTPRERRRDLIDHLFLLRDCGRLVGADAHLFSSPFLEICLVGRLREGGAGDGEAAAAWTASCRQPNFGRRPRQRAFHGWMFGLRCQPRGGALDHAALVRLSGPLIKQIEDGAPIDALARGLDDWAEAICAGLAATMEPGPTRHDGDHAGDALDRCLAASKTGAATSVVSLAASARVTPRTLQRRFRDRTGLAPKRFMALQRFRRAMRAVASDSGDLVQIALDAGYCDQAHLSADLKRHAGLSPSRFRALAKRQVMPQPVRFFQDPELQERARLVMCPDAEEMAGRDLHSEGSSF